MPKTIGGTRVGRANIDVVTSMNVKNRGAISDIQDSKVRREVQQAIGRFQSQYGLPTRDIGITDLNGAYGVAFVSGPNQGQVLLDRKLFSNHAKLIKAKRAEYKTGFKVTTNAPVKHTVTHELAHIKWNDAKVGSKYQKAGEEIKALYKQFRAQVAGNIRRNRTARKQSPIGMYATTNINEFYAEALTGSIIGVRQNKYTRAIRRITLKYGL